MEESFVCKLCNLPYKTRTGLWKHNTKYHTSKTNKSGNISAKTDIFLAKNGQKIDKNIQNQQKEIICNDCEKIFTRKDSLQKHFSRCKVKNSKEAKLIEEKEFYKEKSEIFEKKLEKMEKEMKKEIAELKKATNSSKNKQINYGSINNGKIINNININPPCHELVNLSKAEVEEIMSKQILSVIAYIEKVNFNHMLTSNHSFCTTNLAGKYLLQYDQETSSIKSTKKEFFYEQIINNAIMKIENIYNKKKNKFNTKKKEQFEDVISRLKDIQKCHPNKRILKKICDELNLLCYNSRETILKTWNHAKGVDISNVEMEMGVEMDDDIIEDYKEIFLPVKEYLEQYNNYDSDDDNVGANDRESESTDSTDEEESETEKKPLVIKKKKITKKAEMEV